MKEPNWTAEEKLFLRRNYNKMSFEELGNILHRTASAVHDKSKKMKLFRKPKKIPLWYRNIPTSVRAYLAGHFDGEGCASFRKRETRRTPEITVSITHRETLVLYQKYFNGKISEAGKVRKQQYRWKIVSYEYVYNFIMAVMPFIIEKKEQLLLLKKYIDTYNKQGRTVNLSSEFIAFSNELWDKCSALKKV